MSKQQLTPQACAAIEAQPRQILERWFAGLGTSARMKYRQALRSFSVWATGASDPQPDDTLRLLVDAGRVDARQLAVGWRDSMLAAGRASGTVAGLVSALVSLVKACRACGVVDWHLDLVAPTIEPRCDRRGPPREEIEQLLAHLDELAAGGDARAARDVAIVRLLHNAALRRNEVVQLQWPDHVQLERSDGPAVLPRRKGKRERQAMTIGTRAAESLRAWLAARGDWPGPLFVRLHAAPGHEDATPLSGEAVRLMLRQRAKEAGCRATFRPHGMRHAAATHAARNGSSLAELLELGGWESMHSVARYVHSGSRERGNAVKISEM